MPYGSKSKGSALSGLFKGAAAKKGAVSEREMKKFREIARQKRRKLQEAQRKKGAISERELKRFKTRS